MSYKMSKKQREIYEIVLKRISEAKKNGTWTHQYSNSIDPNYQVDKWFYSNKRFIRSGQLNWKKFLKFKRWYLVIWENNREEDSYYRYITSEEISICVEEDRKIAEKKLKKGKFKDDIRLYFIRYKISKVHFNPNNKNFIISDVENFYLDGLKINNELLQYISDKISSEVLHIDNNNVISGRLLYHNFIICSVVLNSKPNFKTINCEKDCIQCLSNYENYYNILNQISEAIINLHKIEIRKNVKSDDKLTRNDLFYFFDKDWANEILKFERDDKHEYIKELYDSLYTFKFKNDKIIFPHINVFINYLNYKDEKTDIRKIIDKYYIIRRKIINTLLEIDPNIKTELDEYPGFFLNISSPIEEDQLYLWSLIEKYLPDKLY